MNATDDAYNKYMAPGGGKSQPTTLMGNWCEEAVLREATGEGRSIPQRHIPRAGILKQMFQAEDQTSLTAKSGGKKGDSTFDRVYGKRVFDKLTKGSDDVGSYFTDDGANNVGKASQKAAANYGRDNGPRTTGDPSVD